MEITKATYVNICEECSRSVDVELEFFEVCIGLCKHCTKELVKELQEVLHEIES